MAILLLFYTYKKCNCTMSPCRSLIYFEAEACLDNQRFSSLLASKIADAAYSRLTGAETP